MAHPTVTKGGAMTPRLLGPVIESLKVIDIYVLVAPENDILPLCLLSLSTAISSPFCVREKMQPQSTQ